MANSKISALTSATTPLAGTETLPIVQSSTTKQVSVANLTAGRQVDMSLLSVSSSAALLGNFNSTNATGGYLRWQTSGTTIWDIGTAKQVFGTGTGTDGGFGTRAGYYLGLGANGAESLRLTTTGDVSVLTGNLVMGTSGKGVTDSTGGTLLSFTTQRVESNKPIRATSVSTTSGDTASTATATPVTLFAVSSESVWIVNAAITGTGAPAAYTAVAIVKSSGGVAAATPISAATNLTITVSGLNVQATQTSGVSQIMSYSAVRLF